MSQASSARRGRRPAKSAGRPRSERNRRSAGVFDREPWLVPLLGGAFVVSGAAGLIHEVVWTRLLGHLFGVSSFAISTVLAAYMGGLALGSWWMGERAERFSDQRKIYARLELGIGFFALAVPGILSLVAPLYGWIWRYGQFSFAVFTTLRFVIASIILLVPTALMGATLPVLAEYLARREGRRMTPQWLYTLNLAGAVAGVALAGFVLMPSVGVWGTIIAGVILNLGVAGVVLALPPVPSDGAVREQAVQEPQPDAAAGAESQSPALLGAAFVSGLLSLATQVAWTRVLVLVVGSTTWAFSSVLLVVLVCLGLGSAIASRISERVQRRARALRDPAVATDALSRAICVAFLLAAGLTVIAIVVTNRLPQLYYALYSISEETEISGMVFRGVLTAFAVLFPPLLAAGTILPFTLATAVRDGDRRVGSTVGRIYAVNTLGAIAGSILGGFALVPVLGSQSSLLWLAAVAALMAVPFLLRGERPTWLTIGVVASGAMVALALLVLPRWNQSILHGGVFEPGRFGGYVPLQQALTDAGETVIFHREGRTASVLVTDFSDGVRSMRIDSRSNASTHPGDMATQTMLAAVPLLLARRTDDVFIVGWGSGVTVGTALQFPVKRVTAVELEPAVVEASRFFKHVNHDPESDPRLTLYEDDARHILLASNASYDVIISEPPHPWVAGVANLFTKDFYELASRRLNPGGMFTQWLQTYEMTTDTYRTILATVTSVFPHAMVFYTPYTTDTVIVASREPFELHLDRLEERWLPKEAASVSAELARIGLKRPEYFLSAATLGPEQVRAFARGAPLNTDDNMLIEFHAAKGSLGTEQVLPDVESRTPGLEGLVADANAVLDSPDRLRAYIGGLQLMERDSTRYVERLRAEESEARAADESRGSR